MGCGGGYINFAYIYMVNRGTATTQLYGSNNNGSNVNTCRIVPNTFRVKNYTQITGGCSSLTTALASQPIAVYVDATNWMSYANGVFSGCDTTLNHAALLVGQTDTYWTIKNSWGATWGQSGYIQLAPGNTCGLCNNPWYPTPL